MQKIFENPITKNLKLDFHEIWPTGIFVDLYKSEVKNTKYEMVNSEPI